MRTPRRRSLVEFLVLFSVLAGLFYFILGGDRNDRETPGRAKTRRKKPESPLPCSQLAGADDTVVVLKTSAAELEDRLPIHFDTTLLCYPNYLIFSDYPERYEGYPIYDALASVDKSVKSSSPDFELWRRLRKQGPDGLEDEELWNPDETVKDLDKWKHLPIVEQTFAKYPDKKWYVFLETDTFIFWSNLLIWLRQLDYAKPYYIGAQKRGEDAIFARGGSGIVLSQAAIRSLVELYTETKAAWEAYAQAHSNGASIFGKALEEAGVSLTQAWPIFQNHRPADMDYHHEYDGRRLWCYPTVSYHGISQPNIAEMWRFEQQWIKEKPNTIMHHYDVFSDFILPRLIVRSGRVDDWDNFSGTFDQGSTADDIDVCRDRCVANSECVQFAFANGTCEFSNVPKMGDFRPGVESRWLLARVQRFGKQIDACVGDEEWIAA